MYNFKGIFFYGNHICAAPNVYVCVADILKKTPRSTFGFKIATYIYIYTIGKCR